MHAQNRSTMSARHRLALAALLGLTSCAAFTPAKNPECDDKVNRCMERCESQPEATSEAHGHAADDPRLATPQSRCQDNCRNQCR